VERVSHGPMVGSLNPRCATCGKNQMAIQRDPFAACVVPAPVLPFEMPAPRPPPRPPPDLRVRGKG